MAARSINLLESFGHNWVPWSAVKLDDMKLDDKNTRFWEHLSARILRLCTAKKIPMYVIDIDHIKSKQKVNASCKSDCGCSIVHVATPAPQDNRMLALRIYTIPPSAGELPPEMGLVSLVPHLIRFLLTSSIFSLVNVLGRKACCGISEMWLSAKPSCSKHGSCANGSRHWPFSSLYSRYNVTRAGKLPTTGGRRLSMLPDISNFLKLGKDDQSQVLVNTSEAETALKLISKNWSL